MKNVKQAGAADKTTGEEAESLAAESEMQPRDELMDGVADLELD